MKKLIIKNIMETKNNLKGLLLTKITPLKGSIFN